MTYSHNETDHMNLRVSHPPWKKKKKKKMGKENLDSQMIWKSMIVREKIYRLLI